MSALVLINSVEVEFKSRDESVFIDSLALSKVFKKRHDHILRNIENLPNDEFKLLNFNKSDYLDNRGRLQPCYNLTKDGFCFLVMGFTGEKAYKWKVEFIKAFNRLLNENRALKYAYYTDKIANLQAAVHGITKRFNLQINGYKGQAAVQKKENKDLLDKLAKIEKFAPPSDDFPTYAELFERYARIYRAKKELENSKETYTQKNENAVLMLNDINKDLATAYRKIGAAMSYLGDVFGNGHFIKDKFKK